MAKVLVDAQDSVFRFHFDECEISPTFQKHPMERVLAYYKRAEDKQIGRGCVRCGMGRRFSIVRCLCGELIHLQISMPKFSGPKMDTMLRTAEGNPVDPASGLVIRKPMTDQMGYPTAKPTPHFPVATNAGIPEVINYDPNTAGYAADTSMQSALDAAQGLTPGIAVPSPVASDSELAQQNEAMRSMIERQQAELDRLSTRQTVESNPGSALDLGPSLSDTLNRSEDSASLQPSPVAAALASPPSQETTETAKSSKRNK